MASVRTLSKRRHATRRRHAAHAKRPRCRGIAWSVGAELARGTTRVVFPPAPEPLPWDHLDVLSPRLGALDYAARRDGLAALDHLAAMRWGKG